MRTAAVLSVLSASIVTGVEKYSYRLLTPSSPPPATRLVGPRISRQLDTRLDSPPSGPYLNKEGFFSSGFLEDLFGLGRPAEPAITFPGTEVISLLVLTLFV